MTAKEVLTIILMVICLFYTLFIIGGSDMATKKYSAWAYIATVVAVAIINLF